MVTLNRLRHDYKEENPSLWPQSIHEQVKSPESGSEGNAAVLGQRENYCLPDSPHPQGNGFQLWFGISHLESFTKHRFPGHPRPTMYFRGDAWEYIAPKSAIGDRCEAKVEYNASWKYHVLNFWEISRVPHKETKQLSFFP